MNAHAIEIRAEGGACGDRWCGAVEIPTPAGGLVLQATVRDEDVRGLVALLRRAHRALHQLDAAALPAELARAEIAWRAQRAQGAEVGVWPIVAAIAIPLITAAAGYGVSATQPGAGGRTASGSAITTFSGSPMEDAPRTPPSIEEIDAQWGPRANDPDTIIPEVRDSTGSLVVMSARTEPNYERRRREMDREWLSVYLRGYFGTIFQRADQVPAEVRAAWDAARRSQVPLWRVMGLQGPPASPVPLGQSLAGSAQTAQGFTATTPWSEGSASPGDAFLRAIIAGAAGAAGGGINATTAVARMLPVLAQMAQTGNPQAAAALAMLSQAAPALAQGLGGGALQAPGQSIAQATQAAALAQLLGGGGASQGALAQLLGGGGASGATPAQLAQLAQLLGGGASQNPLAGLLGGALAQPGATPPQLAQLLAQLGAGAQPQTGLAGLLGASGLLGAAQGVAPGAPQLTGAQTALGALLGGAPGVASTSSPLLSQLLGRPS